MQNWSSKRPDNAFECKVLDTLCASELPGVVIANVIIPRLDPTNSLHRLPDEHDILVFMDGHIYTLDMKELHCGVYRGFEATAEFSPDGHSWNPLPRHLWPHQTAFKKVRVLESFYRQACGPSLPTFVGGIVVPDSADVTGMTDADGSMTNRARILLTQLSKLGDVLQRDVDQSLQRRPKAEEMAHAFRARPEPFAENLPCQVDEHLRLDQLLARRSHPVAHKIYRGFYERLRVPVRVEMLQCLGDDLPFMTAQRAYRASLQALAILRHPAIPRYYPPVELHNTILILYEYFSDYTLSDRAIDQPMPWPDVRHVFFNLVEALRDAHEHRIVHRHINPDCILVAPGERPEIRIGGFFGAAVQGFTIVEDTSFGSPYRAPEYNDESRWRTPLEDAYAVGRCLCAVLTGDPRSVPSTGAPSSVLNQIPLLVADDPSIRVAAWEGLLSTLKATS